MANLKQTSITGSSGTTTLLVSGSSIVMPSMSGSVDSGSAAQMYIDVTPTAGLTMKLTQAGSFGTQNSPFSSLGAWNTGGTMITCRGRGIQGVGVGNAALAIGGVGGYSSVEEYNGSSFASANSMPANGFQFSAAGTQNAALSMALYPNRTEAAEYDGTNWSTITDSPASGRLGVGGGFQNAAWMYGNGSYQSAIQNWNGSAWSSGATVGLSGNQYGGGTGTQTNVLSSGFASPGVGKVQLYDGNAWSSGNDRIVALQDPGASGTADSAVMAGGRTPTSTSCVEEYNGTIWSISNALPVTTNRGGGLSGGNSTVCAGLSLGGYQSGVAYEYNKEFLLPFTYDAAASADSWSGAGNMITATRSTGGAGTQNAALAAGGSSVPAALTTTQEFNGSTWSAGGGLSVARCAGAGGGTQNAAFLAGGVSYPQYYTCTEEYNGTSWSPGGAMITARAQLSGGGTQNAGLAMGGYVYPTDVTCIEEYNGTSWSTAGALSIARSNMQPNSGASQNDGVAIGGVPSATTCGLFEVWNGSSISTGPNLAVCTVSGAGGVESSDNIIHLNGTAPYQNTTQKYNGTSWSTSVSINGMVGGNGKAGAGSGTTAAIFGGVKSPNNPVFETYLFNQATNVCSTTPFCLATWSGGANMLITGIAWAGTGTTNAGLAAGVTSPTTGAQKACTEEYNGSTWSAGGALAIARYNAGAAGTQNAGLAFGGYPASSEKCTEEYNGTAWSPGGALITGVYGMGAGGTQNAAIAAGGGIQTSPQHTNATQLYDGSSWSSGNTIITSRRGTNYGGTQNTGLLIGGYNGSSYVACAESFNGSTWATSTAYPHTQLFDSGVVGVNSNNIIGIGGTNTGAAYCWNGISWKTLPSLSTTRYSAAVGGGDSDNVFVGGGKTPTFINSTELFICADYQVSTWAARTPMNVAVRDGVGGGTINAAIQATGANPSSASGQTQTYNGDSWTTQTSAPVSICESAGGGTQTAFFQASGFPANPTTQIYNGSSWSTGGAVTVCTYGRFGSGTSNAGLLSGFQPASTCTEEYDGSSWSAGGNAIIAKRYAGMNGTQNASISFGGQSPSTMACVELYDGSSWSTGVPLIRISETPAEGGGLCRDEAIQIGGLTPSPTSTRLSNVEVYNGLAWSIGNYLPQPIKNGMNGGTSNGSLMFGGDISPGAGIASTYALERENPVNKGIYCFTKTL